MLDGFLTAGGASPAKERDVELTTVAQAEDAWNDAFLAPTVEPMRLLLHPDFIAVHGPIGHIQDLDEFINDAAARPRPDPGPASGPRTG